MAVRLRGPEPVFLERVPFRDWVENWARATVGRLERERLTLRPEPKPGAAPLALNGPTAQERDSLLFLPPVGARDSGQTGND
ncbi:MAG: hypothetical protein ACREF4_22800, partial [Gammaproteobacteria bacterium]